MDEFWGVDELTLNIVIVNLFIVNFYLLIINIAKVLVICYPHAFKMIINLY